MLAIRWLVVRISAAYSGQVEPMFVLAKDNIDFLYLFVWRQVDKDYIIRCIYKDSWPFCVPYLVWYNYAKNSELSRVDGLEGLIATSSRLVSADTQINCQLVQLPKRLSYGNYTISGRSLNGLRNRFEQTIGKWWR